MSFKKKDKTVPFKTSNQGAAMKPKQKSKKFPGGVPDDSSEEDDEEMERNFALLSQKHAQWNSKEKQEHGDDDDDGEEDVEDEEEAEEEEDEDDSEEGEEDAEVEMEQEEEEGDDSDAVEGEDGQTGEADAGDDDDEEEEEGEEDDDSSDEEPEEQPTEMSKRQGQSEDDVKRELSTMSFEELMQLQNRVGTKAYNKVAYGTDAAQNRKRPDQMKRLSRHKPQEISSKQRVPFLRKVVPVKKQILRDPRFDDLSGEYKPEIFSETYKFINDIQDREKKLVKKNLNKVKSETRKEELKFLLKRMENQERERKRKEQQREKEVLFKKKQRELVGQGSRPFFLKKSDKKKLELAEKFRDLKKSGKLDHFMTKKRKRNATKDRRRLPKKQH
ncbi:ribosomal RNA processing protein 36 homolog [Engraulis encrasicolus]|uniref:ribosomal RNA processing protein 36 homolog n=1 Tax=Engraulis encrasicolus TaxID=184585 RepID=UPI002FD69296